MIGHVIPGLAVPERSYGSGDYDVIPLGHCSCSFSWSIDWSSFSFQRLEKLVDDRLVTGNPVRIISIGLPVANRFADCHQKGIRSGVFRGKNVVQL